MWWYCAVNYMTNSILHPWVHMQKLFTQQIVIEHLLGVKKIHHPNIAIEKKKHFWHSVHFFSICESLTNKNYTFLPKHISLWNDLSQCYIVCFPPHPKNNPFPWLSSSASSLCWDNIYKQLSRRTFAFTFQTKNDCHFLHS